MRNSNILKKIKKRWESLQSNYTSKKKKKWEKEKFEKF